MNYDFSKVYLAQAHRRYGVDDLLQAVLRASPRELRQKSALGNDNPAVQLAQFYSFVEIGNILGSLPDPDKNVVRAENSPWPDVEKHIIHEFPLLALQENRIRRGLSYRQEEPENNYQNFSSFVELDLWLRGDRNIEFFFSELNSVDYDALSGISESSGTSIQNLITSSSENSEDDLFIGFTSFLNFSHALFGFLQECEPFLASAVASHFRAPYRSKKLALWIRAFYSSTSSANNQHEVVEVFSRLRSYSEYITKIARDISRTGRSAEFDAFLVQRNTRNPTETREATPDVPRKLGAPWWADETLTEVVSRLPPRVCEEIIRAASEIQRDHVRAKALASLALCVPDEAVPAALDSLKSIPWPDDWSLAFSALVRSRPESVIETIYDATSFINDRHEQLRVLFGILPVLPLRLRNEGFARAQRAIEASAKENPELKTYAPIFAVLLAGTERERSS